MSESSAKTEPKSIPLFRIDELPHERKQELVEHAEHHLAKARKPWTTCREFLDRLLSVNTCLNIAGLLDLDDLKAEALEVFNELKRLGGRSQ